MQPTAVTSVLSLTSTEYWSNLYYIGHGGVTWGGGGGNAQIWELRAVHVALFKQQPPRSLPYARRRVTARTPMPQKEGVP